MGTYREEIQLMVYQLQADYDKAEYLRDQSDVEGQKIMNEVRRLLPQVWSLLQNLDSSLDDVMANQKI